MTKNSIKQITMPTPFPVGDVHAYLLKGEALSLVDAGVKTIEAKEALEAGLKREGYRMKDIEQVVLTHHHPDHTGLLEEFQHAKAVYGHANNQPWLTKDETFFQRYESFFSDLYRQAGVPNTYLPLLKKLRASLKYAGEGKVTGLLEERDPLPGHGEFTVLETKGHAQSHLSFYRKEDGLLIGGDLLLAHVSSNPLLEPPMSETSERPKPFLQYQRSLKKCLELNLAVILPGHGETITDPERLIRQRLEKAENRARKVLSMLEREPLTAYQVCERIFPSLIENQFSLTMSETIGQLDYLSEKGLIDAEESGGSLLFASKVKI